MCAGGMAVDCLHHIMDWGAGLVCGAAAKDGGGDVLCMCDSCSKEPGSGILAMGQQVLCMACMAVIPQGGGLHSGS